jgi:hypothetical protein
MMRMGWDRRDAGEESKGQMRREGRKFRARYQTLQIGHEGENQSGKSKREDED